MDYEDYNWGFYRGYYRDYFRDPFHRSLLSTRQECHKESLSPKKGERERRIFSAVQFTLPGILVGDVHKVKRKCRCGTLNPKPKPIWGSGLTVWSLGFGRPGSPDNGFPGLNTLRVLGKHKRTAWLIIAATL